MYGTDYSYLTSSSSAASNAVFAGFSVAYLIFAIVVWVIAIVAQWKIFTKAGEAGWKCLIPIYNAVVLFKIAGLSPLWILGFLASIIPVIGGLVVLGISIYLMYSLGKAFGKSTGFIVGLVLLSPIFLIILGFDSSTYQLEKKA